MEHEVYDIYHDESREESYWHGFLFVPRSNRDYLLSLLKQARDGAKWQEFISFKDISNKMGKNSPRVQLVESWLTIALASLQQQKFYKKVSFFICGKPQKYFPCLEKPIKCKFIVFKERDNHRKMLKGLNKMKKIEITTRMGLLGGAHYLFDNDNPLMIGNLVIDKFGSKEKLRKMLIRLAHDLIKKKREYVYFIQGAKIIPQSSNHKKISSFKNPEDSHLLQFTDVLLGAVRFLSCKLDIQHVKYKISYPIQFLLKKDQNNFFEMKETRFAKGFSLTEAWIENGKWEFAPLKLKEDDNIYKSRQLKLSL